MIPGAAAGGVPGAVPGAVVPGANVVPGAVVPGALVPGAVVPARCQARLVLSPERFPAQQSPAPFRERPGVDPSAPAPGAPAPTSSRPPHLPAHPQPGPPPPGPPRVAAAGTVLDAAAAASGGGASNPNFASPIAHAAFEAAHKELGVPYLYGGESPQAGFDCSGLMQWAYHQAGVNLPRVADQQFTVGTSVGAQRPQGGRPRLLPDRRRRRRPRRHVRRQPHVPRGAADRRGRADGRPAQPVLVLAFAGARRVVPLSGAGLSQAASRARSRHQPAPAGTTPVRGTTAPAHDARARHPAGGPAARAAPPRRRRRPQPLGGLAAPPPPARAPQPAPPPSRPRAPRTPTPAVSRAPLSSRPSAATSPTTTSSTRSSSSRRSSRHPAHRSPRPPGPAPLPASIPPRRSRASPWPASPSSTRSRASPAPSRRARHPRASGSRRSPRQRPRAASSQSAPRCSPAGSRPSSPTWPRLTGLDTRVVAGWVLAEESGSAAQGRQAASNFNWLNIGYFDSGTGAIAHASPFSDPVSAAEQTAKFLKGQWGGASTGHPGHPQDGRQAPRGPDHGHRQQRLGAAATTTTGPTSARPSRSSRT